MAEWRLHRDIQPGQVLLGVVQEMLGELKALGATFFRVTPLPDLPIVVVEGWRAQPDDQGPEPELKDVIGFGT